MASVTRSPGTAESVSTILGIAPWIDVDNIKISDQNYSYAKFDFSSGYHESELMKATNFGFSIPNNSTIDGILVEIQRYNPVGGWDATDYLLSIIKPDGSLGNTNKADVSTLWNTDHEIYVSYGGEADLWGESLTPSDINSSNFGVAFSVQVYKDDYPEVDHIRITVYYTESPSLISPLPTFFRQ